MTFLLAHPWALITGMALGLSLGMLLARRNKRRERDRKRRAELAAEIAFARRWQDGQERLNAIFADAFEAAQAEMRRDRIESARKCGCAVCKGVLAKLTMGPN